MAKKKLCPICLEKEISRKGTKCKSCSNRLRKVINRAKRPKVFDKYRTKKICPDCLTNKICYVSKRCMSCDRKSRKGKIKYPNGSKAKMGNLNPMWKGDNVKKAALHEWIGNRKEKPILCPKCNKDKPYDLANISGEYKRDVDDFEWLCRRCHMLSDGRMENLKLGREKIALMRIGV